MKEQIVQAFQDFLFPQHSACMLCGRFLSYPCPICLECIDEMNLDRLKTRAMVTMIPTLDACLSAFRYDGVPEKTVHLLKYESGCAVAPLLGEALAYALCMHPDVLHRTDAIVPVPLHPSRLKKRGYNQAELLARDLCFHVNLPLLNDALVRVRNTNTQVGRNMEERKSAMHSAFAVTDAAKVAGLHLLLVDDVLTTGSTASACAKALYAARAKTVSLITVCKVGKSF